jgi:hypothetical protein
LVGRDLPTTGVIYPKFFWAPCAPLSTLAETPQPPPPPRTSAYIRGRYWSAKIQYRRHLFLTPWITEKEIARLAVTIALKGVLLPTSLKIIKLMILAVAKTLFNSFPQKKNTEKE